MSKVIVLKQNSPEIRQKIKDAGISVCICAEFVDACWLDYHVGLGATYDVHGLGYDGGEMTGEEQIALFLHETETIIECSSVEEFITKIKDSRV